MLPPSSSASRVRPLVVLAIGVGAIGAIGACNLSSEPIEVDRTFGLVYLSAGPSAEPTARAQARAEFFEGLLTSIPNSATPFDSCRRVALPLDTVLTGITDLDAGTAVVLTNGTRVDSLFRMTAAGRSFYVPRGDGTIRYVPGDSIDVDVLGAAGFPRTAIRAKTAEAVTVQPIAFPATGSPIDVVWSTPRAPGSAMIIEFRYASSGSADFDNEVRCFFADDGAGSVPPQLAALWSNPSTRRRDLLATRFRTRIVAGDAHLLDVVSTFGVAVTPVPQP